MWLTWACVVLSAESMTPSPAPSPSGQKPTQNTTVTIAIRGSARSAESANFQVQSCSAFDARLVATSCEQWRTHLQTKWLSDQASPAWSPRCYVVVHGRRDSYRAAIGRGGDNSYGSSWIDAKDGSIRARRVDLLVDSAGALSAFGHELTHVVLADAFAGSQPPLWANEGIAVLADSAEKQRLHRRDLDQSLSSRVVFHSAELLQLDTYPAPHRVATFYGQSASLVSFLNEYGGTQKLVPFLKMVPEHGYDKAILDAYGIAGLPELERLWRAEQNAAPAQPHRSNLQVVSTRPRR